MRFRSWWLGGTEIWPGHQGFLAYELREPASWTYLGLLASVHTPTPEMLEKGWLPRSEYWAVTSLPDEFRVVPMIDSYSYFLQNEASSGRVPLQRFRSSLEVMPPPNGAAYAVRVHPKGQGPHGSDAVAWFTGVGTPGVAAWGAGDLASSFIRLEPGDVLTFQRTTMLPSGPVRGTEDVE